MSYLERLKTSENTVEATLNNQINPPEESSLGFFGTPPTCIEEKQDVSGGDKICIVSNAEIKIRHWLETIGEFDRVIVNEVIDRCMHDPKALEYFLGRAKEVQMPGSADQVDDRITCVACQHYRAKVCGIATPGGVVSARQGYRPVLRLQRCAGYLPVETDNDQRPGSERWPGLLSAGR